MRRPITANRRPNIEKVSIVVSSKKATYSNLLQIPPRAYRSGTFKVKIPLRSEFSRLCPSSSSARPEQVAHFRYGERKEHEEGSPTLYEADKSQVGYEHGYDAMVFYSGYGDDPQYVEGFVRGALERIGKKKPHERSFLHSMWEQGKREKVLEIIKGECELIEGNPP